MSPCDPTPPAAPVATTAPARGSDAPLACRPKHRRARRARGLRLATALGLTGLALAAGAPNAAAQRAEPSERSGRRHGSAVGRAIATGTETGTGTETSTATVTTTGRGYAEGWRSRGIAFLDLPLGLRARYDAQALLRPSAPGPFATSLFEVPDAATVRRTTRLLESRFAVSRVVAPRVELELSWAARSPLAVVDLLRIEEQRVVAMIRFVP